MASKYTTSKIQDTIASNLIDQGPPARYQLETKKQKLDNEGMLRRLTFGERDSTKVNRTVLIVGETGTGKSSVINMMVNYVLGVKQEDQVWFEIVEEEIEDEKKSESKKKSESETTAITVYEVFGFEGSKVPYSLTIIDTPGYGDTRGIQVDQLIAKKLFELFGSEYGVHQIDAVGLVVKSSENRLTVEQKYIFDAVLSLFGKDMEKNIVALITHSDGFEPTNALKALEDAQVPCAKDDSNQSIYFLFNNSQRKSVTSAKATQAKKEERILKNLWDISEESMEEFTEFLGRITPQSVKMTEGVLREQKHLEACVSNIRKQIHLIDLKQNEIKQTQEALDKHKKDMEENKNFSNSVEEKYKGKANTTGGEATTCTVCEENCHYPGCWWVKDLSWCTVMKNYHCTRCTGKCHYTKHVKEKKKYVFMTRQVTRTNEILKKKYDINDKAAGEKETLISRLQSELKQFTSEKARLVEKSYQCVINLEEKALKTSSLSTAQHLDFLIENVKETGNTEKVQKLEKMKRRAEEEHKGTLDYFKAGVKKMDTSSKIQDTIAKSSLIDKGTPARYQLVTKKNNLDDEDQLRRWTFGERDHSKLNKTVLIVGETGTGKSTLINAMVNYILGVEWEDKVWFEIVEEEKRPQTEAQTTAVTVYEVFGFEGQRVPFSLTIIDTPGYGNTRGIGEDQLISKKLFELFRSVDGIDQLDAVGLVVKATENRLNDRQKYIFDAVLSLFGKDMENNIVTLVTHSDGRPPKNALEAIIRPNVPCAKNDRNQPVHFVFHNCQCEVFDKEYEDYEDYVSNQKTVWDKGAKSMDKFFEYKMEPKSVKMTEGVIRERKQLEECVSNLHERIHMVDLKQDEIKQTQKELCKHKKVMEENKDFTYTVEEPYKEKLPTEGGEATTCTVCEENCHYPGCRSIKVLSWCSAMKNYHCTVCTGKCHYTKHVKGKEKYVLKTRVVLRTHGELKKRYDINEKAVGEKETLISKLQTELKQFTLQKFRLVEESYLCLVILEEIALKSLPLSTAQHLGFLIDKMTETGHTEKVQKLKEMKKRAEEELKDA